MRALRVSRFPWMLRAGPTLLGLAAALALHTGHGAAQIPFTVFNDATEVGSLDFRFTSGRSFKESRLRQEIVLTERGALAGLRDALSFLPFIPDVGVHPFSPIELQRDVARLRRFYAESGFIATDIRYEVEYDEGDNRVDVTLIVAEGKPITVRSVDLALRGGGEPTAHLPESLVADWRGFVARSRSAVGQRLTQAERSRRVSDVMNWWMNRGWAFAEAEAEASIDSVAAAADLRITMEPGPRARVGPIVLEGNTSVSDDVILRTLPFETGDWFSAQKLAEGQRRIFALDLFRVALADVTEDQVEDSTAHVRIRVQEVPPRLLTGELGYVASGGLSVQGQFAHRNFLGGARTLRVSATAETGQLAFAETPEQNYRLSFSYRRPFLFHPRLSLNVSPFGQYRDDLTDRSWQAGIETSLIYEMGAFRFLTLQHRLTSRRVLDYRLGSGSTIDLITLTRLLAEGGLDTLGKRIDRSTLSLSATIGRLDPTRTTRALQARPAVETTFPSGFNTIEYVQVELPVSGFLPLNDRVALAGQVRLGRVFPFGKTVEGDSIAGLLQAVQLRDVLLTAGGTGSARGWGNNQLGPKFVNLRFPGSLGTDSIPLDSVTASWYAPAGGLARAAASFEVRLPFPGLGESWGTHLFLDAGRVWTPDDRFRGADPNDEQRWFFGAGAGIDYNTLVGPIRVSLGYKLNPSPLDVRHADDVFRALLEDRPIESVSTVWRKRLHLHIALGQTF